MTPEDIRQPGEGAWRFLPGGNRERRKRRITLMDMIDAFRYLGALAIVLALVGAAGLAMRRYGLPGIAGSGRRLAIVDSLMLGRNQRAIILRCDGTEHILVTTRESATLIASGPAKREQERTAA
jgi:flagellar protein FliO/FliZ